MQSVKVYENLWDIKRQEKRGNMIFYLVSALLIVAICAVFVLNAFVFIHVEVVGSSMENTLFDGDVVIVNKWREVKDGDIVVVSGMIGDKWIIKRVIGCPGDEVEITLDGKVKRNGEVLDESYVTGATYKKGDKSRWVLGEDEYFFMGDNRGVSQDSRALGACKRENIVGVVEGWSLYLKSVRGSFGAGCYGA